MYHAWKKEELAFQTDPHFKAPNVPLYHEEANRRDVQLSNVKYDIIMVVGKNNTYSGKVTVKFNLDNKGLQEVFLDFHGTKVIELTINGQSYKGSSITFTQHRIIIPQKYLSQENSVTVKFENEYVHNSAGLHQFVDPVDSNMYFYTHLEPFFCHRWFPCFDQPSIRAPMKMKVITGDSNWNVYTNGVFNEKSSIASEKS